MNRDSARRLSSRLERIAASVPDPQGERIPRPVWVDLDGLDLETAVLLHNVLDLPVEMRDELLRADQRPDLAMLRRIRRPEPLWASQTAPVAPETRPEPGRPVIDLQDDLRTDLYRQSWADELRRRFGGR